MKTRPHAHRISWQSAGLALAAAGVRRLVVGFLVGLIVRFVFGTLTRGRLVQESQGWA